MICVRLLKNGQSYQSAAAEIEDNARSSPTFLVLACRSDRGMMLSPFLSPPSSVQTFICPTGNVRPERASFVALGLLPPPPGPGRLSDDNNTHANLPPAVALAANHNARFVLNKPTDSELHFSSTNQRVMGEYELNADKPPSHSRTRSDKRPDGSTANMPPNGGTVHHASTRSPSAALAETRRQSRSQLVNWCFIHSILNFMTKPHSGGIAMMAVACGAHRTTKEMARNDPDICKAQRHRHLPADRCDLLVMHDTYKSKDQVCVSCSVHLRHIVTLWCRAGNKMIPHRGSAVW